MAASFPSEILHAALLIDLLTPNIPPALKGVCTHRACKGGEGEEGGEEGRGVLTHAVPSCRVCVFILGFDGLFTYLQRSAGDAVATVESFPFITPLYLSQSEARECALPQVDAWDPKHEYFTMCLCNPLTGGGPPLSLPPCRCAPRLRFPFLPAAAPQALLSPSFLSWDLSPPFPPFLPSSSPS